MLYDNPNDQGRFLIDVRDEAARQSEIYKRRRTLRLGYHRPSKSDRIQAIAARIFGKPINWVGQGRHITQAKAPFIVYHWIRCHDTARVASVGIGHGGTGLNLLVYKAGEMVCTHYVVLPTRTDDLDTAFRVLGLTSRMQLFARIAVDWPGKRFRINNRDLMPWRYT
jgi:hypothetical protein